VPFIDLKRRFFEWDKEEPPDPDMLSRLGLDDRAIEWASLLTKRRVVILAEAGSGKSAEFSDRAAILAQSHQYVFSASVEDVGREGLSKALPEPAARLLAKWRKGRDEAWFFIDSVDEAKVAGIRFEQVVRKVADGIHGAAERAHIFLSCRVTDWEPKRDLGALAKSLPLFTEISKSEPTAKQELLRILNNERKRNESPAIAEAPFIGLMAPLNRDRIRQFAEASGVPNVEKFLQTIDESNLWRFARRPLDLDWLTRLWRSTGRLGTLQEMIQTSVKERLRETNSDRRRNDSLNAVSAQHAIERIGAAMVFGRKRTITIPDGNGEPTPDSSLVLGDILPDWSSEDQIRLMTRPVFDPETLGRIRLHNDNEGAVSSFLAAQWLLRLRTAELSTARLLRLLFTTSYGLPVVRPSLTYTAAWLSLWDKDVAAALVKVSPNVLLNQGDPASLSPETRKLVLTSLLKELTTDEQEWPSFDNEQLRQFAQPDLAEVITFLWPQYQGNPHVLQLLLRLVWLGRLHPCAQLAQQVLFDRSTDEKTRLFASNAFFVTANESGRKDYAAFVNCHQASLPARILHRAVVELFPKYISISQFLAILDAHNIENEDVDINYKLDSAELAVRLQTTSDLENFINGLLGYVGMRIANHSHSSPKKREAAFFPALAEAALRLLQGSSADVAPHPAVDALMLICNRRDTDRDRLKPVVESITELHKTAERRQQAFWRVVDRARKSLNPQPVEQFWQIESLGYLPGFRLEDIKWLLIDGLQKGGADCRIAVTAALDIYRSHGSQPSVLKRISTAVKSDPIGREVVAPWTTPRVPSASEVRMDRQNRRLEKQNEAAIRKRDTSWINFIQRLRKNPKQIARLADPPKSGRRRDLLLLWQLLNGANTSSRHSIDSVAPLIRIAGAEVTKAVEAALIAHWRKTEPLTGSRRSPQEQNSVRPTDLMGLAGIGLEAGRNPNWAKKLSVDEAYRAAEYATLEINGFPSWISDLSKSHPIPVRDALYAEIRGEVGRESTAYFHTTYAVNDSDDLGVLLAPLLLRDLETSLVIGPRALPLVLRIIVGGAGPAEKLTFERFALQRFKEEADSQLAIHFVSAVFSFNPKAATETFLARARKLKPEEQSAFVNAFLTASLGSTFNRTDYKQTVSPSADVVEKLMLFSFRTHARVVGRQRRSGTVFVPDATDFASDARSALFNTFVSTPGPATYQALRRLERTGKSPVRPMRLRALAEQRALDDSEMNAWPASEAYAFEKSNETAPENGKDLRSVLIGRIEDMQHELLHDDFAQGQTLKSLPLEDAVQIWIADRLQLRQGRSFSVERESHVVEGRKPDVRVRAKVSDARAALEVKVAEDWNLRQLYDALETQLCGQYLRSDKARYGVLLLVYKNKRPQGWKDKTRFITFPRVVELLRKRALEISGQSTNSPQPDVAVLDVSDVSLKTKARGRKRSTGRSAKKARRKKSG